MPHPCTVSLDLKQALCIKLVAIPLLLHVQSPALWEACRALWEQLLRAVLLVVPHLTPYPSVAGRHTLKNISTIFGFRIKYFLGIHAENKQNYTITKLLAGGEGEFGLRL